MKSPFRKSSSVGKGAPSGFIISLLFHAVAFFVAGLFVVFTVLPKAEPEFKAPLPVERPKMKLKKPKVKVKKSSQPKPSSRIVAKVKSPNMPEIQLPDLMGTGEGLLGGMGVGGEFMDLPELGETTIFGGGRSTGSDLKGTYYDLNRTRSGNVHGIEPMSETGKVVSEFIKTGCDKRVLSKYYQSPPLYAVGVVIPPVYSPAGPVAFGQDPHVAKPQGWFVHYEGKLVHPTDIRFRFWGTGDDLMVVMVDKKVVLDAGVGYNSPQWVGDYVLTPGWHQTGTSMNDVRMGLGSTTSGTVGWSDWIDLKGGVARELDIIIGEAPGGHFDAMLNVQVDGVEYQRNRAGFPIYPMFKTDNLSWEQQDAIYQYLVPGESCLTNGPVFRDY